MRLFDTTLRDGLQAPRFKPALELKLEIAKALSNSPVSFIELAHFRDKEESGIAQLAEVVAPNKLAVLSGDTPRHVRAATDFLKQHQGSVLHIYSLSNTARFSIEQATAAIRLGVDAGMRVRWSGFDINRVSEVIRRTQVLAALDAGAAVIGLPDSLGVETPATFAALAEQMRECCGDRAQLALHCHDDKSCAVENSIAGIEAGADEVECTLGGVGTRKGNCSLFALLDELPDFDSSDFASLRQLGERVARESGQSERRPVATS